MSFRALFLCLLLIGTATGYGLVSFAHFLESKHLVREQEDMRRLELDAERQKAECERAYPGSAARIAECIGR